MLLHRNSDVAGIYMGIGSTIHLHGSTTRVRWLLLHMPHAKETCKNMLYQPPAASGFVSSRLVVGVRKSACKHSHFRAYQTQLVIELQLFACGGKGSMDLGAD